MITFPYFFGIQASGYAFAWLSVTVSMSVKIVVR